MTREEFLALKPGDKVQYRDAHTTKPVKGVVVEVGHAATVFKWDKGSWLQELRSVTDESFVRSLRFRFDD